MSKELSDSINEDEIRKHIDRMEGNHGDKVRRLHNRIEEQEKRIEALECLARSLTTAPGLYM